MIGAGIADYAFQYAVSASETTPRSLQCENGVVFICFAGLFWEAGYFRQDMQFFDDFRSVLDNVRAASNYDLSHIRTVLARTALAGCARTLRFLQQ